MSKPWKFEYPKVLRENEVSDKLHGFDIPDPYRWLENSTSDATKQFVDAQNAVSKPYIKACSNRTAILTRLENLMNYTRYGCPMKHGKNYFMTINTGLQNQSVMYIMRSHLISPPEVFFDPNALSSDGTVALSQFKFSWNGEYFAHALSKSGSDWNTIKIRNVENGKDLLEELQRVKFSSISWTHDNKGFFYSAYPISGDGTETSECVNQKLFYHRLETAQEKDILVFERPKHPQFRFQASVSTCGNYLHVFTNKSCEYNLFHFFKFDDPLNPNITEKITLTPVVTKFNADYHYVGNDGPIHYIRTNRKASNFRLVSMDLTSVETAAEENWIDLIPANDDVLDTVVMARKDLFICEYLRDVTGRLQIHKLDGSKLKDIPLQMGSVSGLFARRNLSEIFFSFTSFLVPGNVYYQELDEELSNIPILFKESKLPGFNPNEFVSQQVFYPSKDGTKIPMFIIHHKNLIRNSEAPAVLYGYGGFNISILPFFSPSRIVLMQNLNGVFAVANIRGGGEYGEKWHDGGKLKNKQNCFDDFSAAATFLIENKFTRSEKLAIQGGSNGGLLVAACCNQRPDLFGAGIAQVGVMDMLRFHKFTIGHAWTSDYGNPDNEEDFKSLIKYSPLHNVPEASAQPKYPAMLLLTADHDDRVVPLHTYKLIAELQFKLGSLCANSPLLARIDTKAGHGAGKPISKTLEETADIYSFLINSLGLSYQN